MGKDYTYFLYLYSFVLLHFSWNSVQSFNQDYKKFYPNRPTAAQCNFLPLHILLIKIYLLLFPPSKIYVFSVPECFYLCVSAILFSVCCNVQRRVYTVYPACTGPTPSVCSTPSSQHTWTISTQLYCGSTDKLSPHPLNCV